MNEDNLWLDNELNDLKKDETSFKLIAFLNQSKLIVQEQQKRIKQAQDELDGRMWSPDKW